MVENTELLKPSLESSLPDQPPLRPNFSSIVYSWAALPVLESRTCKTLSPFHDRGDGEQRHDLQEER